MRVLPNEDMRTHLEWVLAGYRVPCYAKCVGQDKTGEPLYSYEDVEKDDEDI